MPNTIGGALRAAAVAWGGVNARVFRDSAPDGATFPYVTYLDPISTVPRVTGDGRVLLRDTQVQFSLWQKVREEDDALLPGLVEALEGAALVVDSGRKLFPARVSSIVRVTDPDALVVHHALTVGVNHAGV
jgi:hypothetical protein